MERGVPLFPPLVPLSAIPALLLLILNETTEKTNGNNEPDIKFPNEDLNSFKMGILNSSHYCSVWQIRIWLAAFSVNHQKS